MLSQQMEIPHLQILNASAGAGKTYSLVRNYLYHCFLNESPDYFRHILAITFTNKAAHEMKERVVSTLIALAENNAETVDMGRDFLALLEISPDVLQKRARQMLRHMLHAYALLSISTIDHFNHRLIRTFAMELELANNFNLELDSDFVFSSVADLAIDQLGTDSFLTTTVLSFVEQQLQSDKSWRIKNTLSNVARLMLREDSVAPVEALKNLSETDLTTYREDLQAYRKEVEGSLKDFGKKGLEIIGNMPFEAFPFSAVPKFLAKLKQGTVEFELPSRVRAFVYENKWFTKNKDAYNVSAIAPELSALLREVETFLAAKTSTYCLAELILRDLHGLSLIKKLDHIYSEFKTAENLLPIGEFNRLISKEVREQPTPFIYERIGERYLHYFIDEFQDTSLMQWSNLRPLIRHAISSGGSALLVGDPKQAIYRWRGGEVQQFVDLTHNRDVVNKIEVKGKLQETFPIINAPLADNWRSRKEIVDFNNRLFETLSQEFSNPDNQEIYAAAHQNPQKSTGGMVVLRRLPGKNAADFIPTALDETYQTITKLLEEGFSKSDITILVRRNTEGRTLVLDFANRPVPLPVISSESLTLSESAHASFLVAMAGMLLNPGDKIQRFEVLTYLIRYHHIHETASVHEFLERHIQQSPEKFVQDWQRWFPDWNPSKLMVLSPVELFEHLMRMVGLADNPDAFTQKLLNMAHEVAAGKDNSINAFLEVWEEKAAKISVSPPDDMDALRVMTIHKAKGLQFPVVMVPFADWSTAPNNDEKVWVPLEEGPLEFAHLPVTYPNSHLIGGAFAEMAAAAKEATKFDAMNMLYVATTRAEHRLYVFTKLETRSGDVSAWLEKTWPALGFDAGDTGIWGQPTLPASKTKMSADHWQPEYKVRTNGTSGLLVGRQAPHLRDTDTSARKMGKMIHSILEHAQNAADVEVVVNDLVLQGQIMAKEAQQIAAAGQAVFEFEPFAALLRQTKRQLAERAILAPEIGLKRPDRILELNDGSWVIVDFKTGQPQPAHQEQVKTYCELLRQTGFPVVSGFLLYLNIDPFEWVPCI